MATTYLGNKQLHAQHVMEIEPGPVPRARVLDQHVIDMLLNKKHITLGQHFAAEYCLRQAAMAGSWAKGINWNSSGGGKGKPDYTPKGIHPYGNTLSKVKERFGEFHVYLLNEIIVHDWDITKSESFDYLLTCLCEVLDYILDHRAGVNCDPLRGLLELAKKKASPKTGPKP